MGVDDERIDIDLEIGETVQVTDGPFEDFTGRVEEIDKVKENLKFQSICLVVKHLLN